MSVSSKMKPSDDSRVIGTYNVLYLLFQLACPQRSNPPWGIPTCLRGDLLPRDMALMFVEWMRGGVCLCSFYTFIFSRAKEGGGRPGIQHEVSFWS